MTDDCLMRVNKGINDISPFDFFTLGVSEVYLTRPSVTTTDSLRCFTVSRLRISPQHLYMQPPRQAHVPTECTHMRVNSIDVGGLRDQWDFNVELRNSVYTRISQVQVRTMYLRSWYCASFPRFLTGTGLNHIPHQYRARWIILYKLICVPVVIITFLLNYNNGMNSHTNEIKLITFESAEIFYYKNFVQFARMYIWYICLIIIIN